MSAHQRYIQYRKDELYHFNPYHDPKSGRFSSSRSGASSVNTTNTPFDSQNKRNISFGNNPNCIQVLEPGGSKQTAEKIANNKNLDKLFRKHAAKESYDYNSKANEDKASYAKRLICQQINVGEFRDPIGDGSRSDVSVWYGEGPDTDSILMYYNSQTNSIVYSQRYY